MERTLDESLTNRLNKLETFRHEVERLVEYAERGGGDWYLGETAAQTALELAYRDMGGKLRSLLEWVLTNPE